VSIARLDRLLFHSSLLASSRPLTCTGFESRSVLIQFLSECLIGERLAWLGSHESPSATLRW